ncbi:MAG: hypothetical protein RSE13_21890 [Planktothrix sp. GU0601_MAG3]|nr:MAG: hypothetical protein RSE13_21890 [Planktothrix sp. GU0601_MAG3]
MTTEPNSSPSQGLEDTSETLNGAAPKPALEPSEVETSTQAIQPASGESWEIETENPTLDNRPNQVSGFGGGFIDDGIDDFGIGN